MVTYRPAAGTVMAVVGWKHIGAGIRQAGGRSWWHHCLPDLYPHPEPAPFTPPPPKQLIPQMTSGRDK